MINNVFHFEIFPVNDSQHQKGKQAIQPGPIVLGSDSTSAESLATEESVSARGRVRTEFATSMKETLLTDCVRSMLEPLFADSGDSCGTVFPVSEGTRLGLTAILF